MYKMRWLEKPGALTVLQEYVDGCYWRDVPTVAEKPKAREFTIELDYSYDRMRVWDSGKELLEFRGKAPLYKNLIRVREVLCNHKDLDNQKCEHCGEIAPPREII